MATASNWRSLPRQFSRQGSAFDVAPTHEDITMEAASVQRMRSALRKENSRAVTASRSAPVLPPVEAPKGVRPRGKRLSMEPKMCQLDDAWEFLLADVAPEVLHLGQSKSMPHLDGGMAASRIDLLDLPEPPRPSTRAPEKGSVLEMSLDNGRHAVPFEAMAWGSEADALGEVFAATTGKLATPFKAPKKSKRIKSEDKRIKTASSEASADEFDIEATTARSTKSTKSSRSSRRRPASTSCIRPCETKVKVPLGRPCFGASPDDNSWRSHLRMSLQPLAGGAAQPWIELEESKMQASDIIVEDASAPPVPPEGLNSPPVPPEVEVLSRPSSASASRQTIARVADPNLWNIGFNDDNGGEDMGVWDDCREIYAAWGGDDDDWGEPAVSRAAASYEADWGEPDYAAVPVF